MNCTLFSIRESDLALAGDATLPTYDEASARVLQLGPLHALELGPAWSTLHASLGDHAPGSPLAFLAAGGEPVPALGDGMQSSGRYFAALLVVQILAAVAQITKPAKDVERLRVFLGEAVAADRGVVVHVFK